MPIWVEAGLWGLLAGGAPAIGAAIAWLLAVPRRPVPAPLAFRGGGLISAPPFALGHAA